MKKLFLITLIFILCIGASTLTVSAKSLLGRVTSVSVTNKTTEANNTIKVKFKKVKGADGYLIKYSTSSKWKNPKYKRIKSGRILSATLKNLKSDKKYCVKVKAYKTEGKKYIYGKYSKTKSVYTYILPGDTSITKLENKSTVSKGKIKVKYKKSANAEGYYIQFGTSPDCRKGVATTIEGDSTTSFLMHEELRLNTKYHVRIRAYRKVKGKTVYGKYSNIKTVSTVRPIGKVTLKKVENKTDSIDGKIKVSYKKVADADGYQIKYSKNSNFKNSKAAYVKSGDKTSKTIDYLSFGETYYVKVRAYCNIDSKRYYGPYSKVLKVKTGRKIVKTYKLSDYMYKSTKNDPFYFSIYRENLKKGKPNIINTNLKTEKLTMYNLNWLPWEDDINSEKQLEYIRAWYYLYSDINKDNMDGKYIRIYCTAEERDSLSSRWIQKPGGGFTSAIWSDGKYEGFYEDQSNDYSDFLEKEEFKHKTAKSIFKQYNITSKTTKEQAIIDFCVYMALNYEYDDTLKNSYAYDMMKYKTGVCNAYADVLCYLCRYVGINMEHVVGNVTWSTTCHAWNGLKVNGKYIYTDRTDKTLDMTFEEEEKLFKDNEYYWLHNLSSRNKYTIEYMFKTKKEMEEKGFIFN